MDSCVDGASPNAMEESVAVCDDTTASLAVDSSRADESEAVEHCENESITFQNAIETSTNAAASSDIDCMDHPAAMDSCVASASPNAMEESVAVCDDTTASLAVDSARTNESEAFVRGEHESIPFQNAVETSPDAAASSDTVCMDLLRSMDSDGVSPNVMEESAVVCDEKTASLAAESCHVDDSKPVEQCEFQSIPPRNAIQQNELMFVKEGIESSPDAEPPGEDSTTGGAGETSVDSCLVVGERDGAGFYDASSRPVQDYTTSLVESFHDDGFMAVETLMEQGAQPSVPVVQVDAMLAYHDERDAMGPYHDSLAGSKEGVSAMVERVVEGKVCEKEEDESGCGFVGDDGSVLAPQQASDDLIQENGAFGKIALEAMVVDTSEEGLRNSGPHRDEAFTCTSATELDAGPYLPVPLDTIVDHHDSDPTPAQRIDSTDEFQRDRIYDNGLVETYLEGDSCLFVAPASHCLDPSVALVQNSNPEPITATPQRTESEEKEHTSSNLYSTASPSSINASHAAPEGVGTCDTALLVRDADPCRVDAAAGEEDFVESVVDLEAVRVTWSDAGDGLSLGRVAEEGGGGGAVGSLVSGCEMGDREARENDWVVSGNDGVDVSKNEGGVYSEDDERGVVDVEEKELEEASLDCEASKDSQTPEPPYSTPPKSLHKVKKYNTFRTPFKTPFKAATIKRNTTAPPSAFMITSPPTPLEPQAAITPTEPTRRRRSTFKPPTQITTRAPLATPLPPKHSSTLYIGSSASSLSTTTPTAPGTTPLLPPRTDAAAFGLTHRAFLRIQKQNSGVQSLLFQRGEVERKVKEGREGIRVVGRVEKLADSGEKEKLEGLFEKWKQACRAGLVELQGLVGPKGYDADVGGGGGGSFGGGTAGWYGSDGGNGVVRKRSAGGFGSERVDKKRKVVVEVVEKSEDEEDEDSDGAGWGAFVKGIEGFEQESKGAGMEQEEGDEEVDDEEVEMVGEECDEDGGGFGEAGSGESREVRVRCSAPGELWSLREIGAKVGIDVVWLGKYNVEDDCFDS
ncbi:hypothetical protein HDU98_004005 [Podochytrium sp. JEL0797]|nr:hypothetical protein HDU98_004005 [Podochytrium sp. JEL0797]